MRLFWKRILDAVFPEGITCNGCGGELKKGDDRRAELCNRCQKRLKRPKESFRFYDELKVYSYFIYDGLVRQIIIDLKDSEKPYLCKTAAIFLYRLVVEIGFSYDVIAFVPTGAKNRKRRGYDHMELVARRFAELDGQHPVSTALVRVVSNADQAELPFEERKKNVKGCFAMASGDCKGKSVLLLDDVVTGGFTLNECADVLLKNGAKEVVGLTLARA